MNASKSYDTLKRWTLAVGVALCWAAPALAGASPMTRVTEAALDRHGAPIEITRTRSPGKSAVTFQAEPEMLADGSVAIIEITSVNPDGPLARWRCVAVDDVSECLGRPVRVPYLVDDEAVVLKVVLAPEHSVQSDPDYLAQR